MKIRSINRAADSQSKTCCLYQASLSLCDNGEKYDFLLFSTLPSFHSVSGCLGKLRFGLPKVLC